MTQLLKNITQCSIFVALCFFTSVKIKAQKNLVPNYSFETFTICPTSLNNTPPPPPWFIPTTQHPNYANICASSGAFSIPNNYFGGDNYQYPRTGNAYIDLGFYNSLLNGSANEMTYIEVKLKDSLQVGKCYYAGYYINLTNACKLATNNAGVLFTKNAVYVDTLATPYGVLLANPQIINYSNPVIKDTQNWIKVSGVFVAQGGEKYITLGNFKTDAQTKVDTVNNTGNNWAIYAIDDVFVIPLDSVPLKADAGKDTSIANVGDSVFIGSLTNGITNITWYNSSGTIINTTAPGFFVHPTASTFYIIEQTVCGYTSRDTVNVTLGTVPLKFINYYIISSLRGTKQSFENIFTTANEVNVSHFNIQRSTNGKDFITIGKLAAQNKITNEYTFSDSLPLEGLGVVYYRIESIDFDGRKQYTETKTINYKPQIINGISIYPNPAKDFVTIESKDIIKQIKVINQVGQIVYSNTINRTSHILNLTLFSKGLYIIQTTKTNGETSTQKLVIDK